MEASGVYISSFWILVFAIFNEEGEANVELKTSVFDQTDRYESYEKCEMALMKEVIYWNRNPIKFSMYEGEKIATIDMSNGIFYHYSCHEING